MIGIIIFKRAISYSPSYLYKTKKVRSLFFNNNIYILYYNYIIYNIIYIIYNIYSFFFLIFVFLNNIYIRIRHRITKFHEVFYYNKYRL